MPKTKQQKEQDLQELSDRLARAKSVVFSEYRGTSVKDMDKFRRTLSAEQVFSKVYKLTLVRKALISQGLTAEMDYKTPVIVALSEEEETTPARVIKNIAKDLKTIGILSGIVDGRLVSKEEVMALADLPSRQELYAKVVGTINAPVSGFVNVLAGNVRGLLNVLNAMAQKS